MSESSLPWPGNKDKMFSEGSRGSLQAYLDFAKYFTTDTLLADAFKKSADAILSQIEAGQISEHPDMYFFPVCYLYRHAIELYLKQLIIHGIQLNILEEEDKLKEIMGDHKLCPLWNKTRIVLEEVWPDGDKNDLKNVERLIQEFHQIDKSGQNFRYSKDKQGNSITRKLPERVDLEALRKICNGLFMFFDGCDAGLSEADQGP